MAYQPQPYFYFDKQSKFSPVKQDFLMDNLSQASTTTNFLSLISSQECAKNQNYNRRASTQTQIQFKNKNLGNNNIQQELTNNNNTINLNININNNLTKNNFSTFNLNGGGIQNLQQQQNFNQSQQNRRFSEFQSVSPTTNFTNLDCKNTNKSAQSLLLFHHNSEKKKINNNFNGHFSINKDFSVEEFNLDNNNNGVQYNINNGHFNNAPSNQNIMEFQSSSEIDEENENKVEIDVKPKRKIFVNVEDKKKFVEDYRKKIKTELCKNFQLKGQCKFGDKCSFAHGYNELQAKTHLHTNYKTKPCKQYFYSGYCAYGYRCQYLHSEIKYLPEFKVFLQKLYQEKNLQLNLHTISSQRNYSQKFQWLSNMTNSLEASINNGNNDQDVKFDQYLMSLKLKRLQVFKKIKTNVNKFSSDEKGQKSSNHYKNYNTDESSEEENLMVLDEEKYNNFYDESS